MQQLAPWSNTEVSEADNADDEYARMTELQAREYAGRLQVVREQRRSLDREEERITRRLAKLNEVLREYERPPIEIPGNDTPASLIGTPGNRSDAMPTRRPEYAELRHADAVEFLITERGPLHADQLVDLIFDVRSVNERKSAKHSLVSALAQAVKKGRLQRIGPNTYQLGYANGAMTATNGTDPTSRSVQRE